MGECSYCAYWCTQRKTVYDDGSEVVNFQSPAGKGRCETLDLDTAPDFGCNKYRDIEHGTPTFRVSRKSGAPWQHHRVDNCPDCGGKGNPNAGASPGDHEVSSRSCDRCQGTGLVRHYDDGFIGEERTRLHPKERELMRNPTCPNCKRTVEMDWMACPSCATKLDAARPTEVIRDSLSIG